MWQENAAEVQQFSTASATVARRSSVGGEHNIPILQLHACLLSHLRILERQSDRGCPDCMDSIGSSASLLYTAFASFLLINSICKNQTPTIRVSVI